VLTDSVPHNHIAIIGTGFGAIATAVRLQQAGFDDRRSGTGRAA
jgi:cation diffusion facilitator CzcD-associated flavoprotein CzcO